MSHRSPSSNAEKFHLLAMLLSGSWNDKNIFMMNAMASDLDTRLKNKTFHFFSLCVKNVVFFSKTFSYEVFFNLSSVQLIYYVHMIIFFIKRKTI